VEKLGRPAVTSRPEPALVWNPDPDRPSRTHRWIQAKSAAYFAAHSTADDQRLPIASSLAKSYTGEAYFRAASANIQIHGGLGFTWEHPAHLYFKRAKSAELLFGDSIYHRSLLAGALQLR